MKTIKDNIEEIRDNIEGIKARLKIKYPITLLGVTKTIAIEQIIEAINCGIMEIGESRIQEAEEKIPFIKNSVGIKIKTHLIGHLQTNKINKAIPLFDIYQSIDKLETAEKLNAKLEELNLPPKEILIEVNTSGDESKYGISPKECGLFINKILNYKKLIVSGFMTIGPLEGGEKDTRKSFKKLYDLKETMQAIYRNEKFKYLSMGMSGDYEMAIEEGSNMVRIGSSIFGDRDY